MSKLAKAAAEDQQAAELLKRDRRIASLESELLDRKAKYKQAVAELEAAERRAAFVADIIDAQADQQWDRWRPELKKPGKIHASAIVLASDWHVGETVDPKKVQGLNEFNQSIAANRIAKFFDKIPEYIDRYVPMARELILWAGGDFITGYLHADQRESNSMAPTEECLFFREHWNCGLTRLRRRIKIPIRIPTCYGNHGRTTEKPRETTAAENSYEWLLYNILAQDAKGIQRVEYKVGVSDEVYVNVHGKLYRLRHGDAVKYGGGIGGVHVPLRRQIGEWNKTRRADYDAIGHFHSFIFGGFYFVNGTLMGVNPYSIKRYGYEPPSQTFIVTDDKHGERLTTRIFCGDR